MDQDDVRIALDKVLSSKRFRRADRRRRFLKYAVEKTLEGKVDCLKESTIGREVFDKENYDPRVDTVVRVTAGHVRFALTDYYAHDGIRDLVVISFPEGSYHPKFERRAELGQHPKTAPVSVGEIFQDYETEMRRWRLLRWEVDIRIENEAGDAEYQTSVCIENASNQPMTLSPAHSVFATVDSGVGVRDIRAYDGHDSLKVEEWGSVQASGELHFRVRSRSPIEPHEVWRYWWEVSWPEGFKGLSKNGGAYTYRGETPANEVLVKIVIPRTLIPLGRPTMDSNGESHLLSWAKVHGRDAIVLHRLTVPKDTIWNVHFKAKRAARTSLSNRAKRKLRN